MHGGAMQRRGDVPAGEGAAFLFGVIASETK
jgi:hypothetical protein